MLVTSLLSSYFFVSAVFAQEWSEPRFIPPEVLGPGMKEFVMRDNGAKVSIYEEVDGQILLAEINYNGDIEPKLTVYPTPSDNILGAAVEKLHGKWVIVINNKQDYETTPYKTGVIIVTIGNEYSTVVTDLVDVNDNPATINVYPEFWSVYENWHGDSDFIIKVDDKDVSCTDFEIKIYDSGVPTGLFTTQDRQGEGCNKMLAFVVTQNLDYETKNWYNLTIEVADGPWKASVEKRLNVWDDWN